MRVQRPCWGCKEKGNTPSVCVLHRHGHKVWPACGVSWLQDLTPKPLDGDPGITVLKGMETGPAVSLRQSTTLLLNIYYIRGNVKHNGEGQRPQSQAGVGFESSSATPTYPWASYLIFLCLKNGNDNNTWLIRLLWESNAPNSLAQWQILDIIIITTTTITITIVIHVWYNFIPTQVLLGWHYYPTRRLTEFRDKIFRL